MEAALCATYAPRDPIGEFWRGDLSLRGLRVLIDGLPPDSAMHRRHPSLAGWDIADHLLADQVDGLSALFNLLLAANTEGGKYEPPSPRARPGDAERAAERARLREKQAVSIRAIVAKLLPPDRR